MSYATQDEIFAVVEDVVGKTFAKFSTWQCIPGEPPGNPATGGSKSPLPMGYRGGCGASRFWPQMTPGDFSRTPAEAAERAARAAELQLCAQAR